MAITPIQIAGPSARKPSALEKVALGFEIAGKALNIGLAIPKFLKEREQMEFTQGLQTRQESRDIQRLAIDKASKRGKVLAETNPASQEDPNAVDFRDLDLGFRTNKVEIDQNAPVTESTLRQLGKVIAEVKQTPQFKGQSIDVSQLKNLTEGRAQQLIFDLPKAGTRNVLTIRGQEATESRFTEKEARSKISNLDKDLDDIEVKYLEKNSGITNAAQQLESGTALGANIAGTNITRTVAGEKGVLTDKDIKRNLPKSLSSDAKDFIVNYLLGRNVQPRTDKQVTAMELALEIASRANELNYALAAHSRLQRFKATWGEIGNYKAVENRYKRLRYWNLASDIDDLRGDYADAENEAERRAITETIDTMKDSIFRVE